MLKEDKGLSKIKNEKISANGFDIQVYTEDFKNDYISLTDIARYKNTDRGCRWQVHYQWR